MKNMSKDSVTITIAKDFSRTPGGRFKKFGLKSGEEFREMLVKSLKQHDQVTVVLDGVYGYASSFLEEVFGGLVRLNIYDKDVISKRLKVIAHSNAFKIYEKETNQYIRKAVASRNVGNTYTLYTMKGRKIDPAEGCKH